MSIRGRRKNVCPRPAHRWGVQYSSALVELGGCWPPGPGGRSAACVPACARGRRRLVGALEREPVRVWDVRGNRLSITRPGGRELELAERVLGGLVEPVAGRLSDQLDLPDVAVLVDADLQLDLPLDAHLAGLGWVDVGAVLLSHHLG